MNSSVHDMKVSKFYHLLLLFCALLEPCNKSIRNNFPIFPRKWCERAPFAKITVESSRKKATNQNVFMDLKATGRIARSVGEHAKDKFRLHRRRKSITSCNH